MRFTEEEWKRIWKMIEKMSYRTIELNMNDTFGYACADSEDIVFGDLLAVTELFEKYNGHGVNAWVAIKRGEDVLPELETKEYWEARKEIESNPLKYDWIARRKFERENKSE